MTKIIYLPQGHSARFTRETEKFGISGIYTDEITTCNILACIAQDRFVLIHVDWNVIASIGALKQIQKDIEWVDEPKDVVIISRSNGKYAGAYGGKRVNRTLVAFLKQEMSLIQILEKELADHDNGIYLSFETAKEGYIHKKVKAFSNQESPEELIHHPQEQQFLSSRLIDYIVGVSETRETGLVKNRQLCIFGSIAWESLREVDLTIGSSHPTTKKEIQSFTKTDSYLDIVKKLIRITALNDKHFSSEEITSKSMNGAIYLEEYLHNYDYAFLFKRNLKQVFNYLTEAPRTQGDNRFKTNINLLLNKEHDVFEEVKQLVAEYSNQAQRTKFITSFLVEYEMFSKPYLDRKKYVHLKEIQLEMRKEALNLSRSATENFKIKNYDAVTNLALEVVKLCTYSCLKNDHYLATAYFNYAQSLKQIGKYQEAYYLFALCLRLREDYPRIDKPELHMQNIKTTQQQLNECENEITKQSKNKSDDSIGLVVSDKNKTIILEDLNLIPQKETKCRLFCG